MNQVIWIIPGEYQEIVQNFFFLRNLCANGLMMEQIEKQIIANILEHNYNQTIKKIELYEDCMTINDVLNKMLEFI